MDGVELLSVLWLRGPGSQPIAYAHGLGGRL